MTENKQFRYYEHKGADYILDNPNTELDFIEMLGDCLEAEEIVDLLNEQETKLKRIEKEVDCNVYHDDLKDIVLEIRCILNGDVE